MRICLIGFGEVGQILAQDLNGHALSAYDLKFSEAASGPSLAANTQGVAASATASAAATGADLIISAVTAAADLDAARSVIEGLKPGCVYLDLNSASPGQKQASSQAIHAAGGRYVEAAVMTPYPPKRIASAMLLGGPYAQAFAPIAAQLGMTGATVFSDIVGQASATKMCRSVMIKGVEALVTESMLTARRYGVDQTVLASLSDLLPVGDWAALARYMISRSLEHGTRRAEEMREVAKTVAEAGVTPTMSTAIAERQDWAAAYKGQIDDDLGAMLDAILGKETHE